MAELVGLAVRQPAMVELHNSHFIVRLNLPRSITTLVQVYLDTPSHAVNGGGLQFICKVLLMSCLLKDCKCTTIGYMRICDIHHVCRTGIGPRGGGGGMCIICQGVCRSMVMD